MTADDLQENRRVCKFPCTSRGEGPQGRPPQAAVGGGLRPPPGPAPPAGGGALCGPSLGRCLRGAGALWQGIVPLGSSRIAAQPGAARPANPMCPAGTGKLPFTARTRRRKPAAGPRCAAAGGAPAGRPARAKPGRPAAVFSPCTGRPKGEKPYPLAPSSSGCSCSPRRAASSAAPVSESSAQRLVGFFRGSSCPKGTK